MSEKRKRLPKLSEVPTLDDIERIHAFITEYIHETPVLTSSSINEMLGCEIYFKCENFQKTGAFKMRGAISAALSLKDNELENGLVTHSSGNHGQGVAMAAKLLDVPSYIVMPLNSSKAKISACKDYGAQVIFCKSNIKSRQEAAEKISKEKNLAFIHPYNDYHVIAGQGTAALELLRYKNDLHYLLTPVSGGGLLSGSAIVAKELCPDLKIIGTEPRNADDAYRSFYAKKLKGNKNTDTICDALRGNLGDKTFPIILDNVYDVITVKEKTIIKAMKLVWERMKIIIEPSCAVPLAAVMENKKLFKKRRVGIILTGGNVDLDKLPF